jgi:cysteine-rich repeat protein
MSSLISKVLFPGLLLTAGLGLAAVSRGEPAGIFRGQPSGREVLNSPHRKQQPLRRKLGRELAMLWADHEAARERGRQYSLRAELPPGRGGHPLARRSSTPDGDRVLIDAAADGEATDLLDDLRELGLQKGRAHGRMVSGYLPVEALQAAALLPSLRFARTSRPRTLAGAVTSQGDIALRADLARTALAVDGTGITVGILSDSFDCAGTALAADTASGDLPTTTTILDDSGCPGTDEGRAMAQVIHDVAPGAGIVFRTAANGQADFAAGILEFLSHGVDVIVADVFYDTEPMFQDGIIAQTVDAAVAAGVPYFAAAGNSGRGSYQDTYRNSGVSVLFDGNAHDFDPGPGVDVHQSITIPVEGEFGLTLQWDSPFFAVSGAPGTPNDLDICLMDEPPTTMIVCGEDLNIGSDPVEVLSFYNDGAFGDQYNLVIEHFEGPAPGLVKAILFGDVTVNEHATGSSTVFGSANAGGAETVGAAFYFETPEFGTSPAVIESFCSRGGTPILFDLAGDRLASPESRLVPALSGPDGVNTTFFGTDIQDPGDRSDRDHDPNFFGTSAAASHVAALAALLLDRNGALSPVDVRAALESTASDMDDPATAGFDTGFDFATGYGFCVGDAALAAVPECGNGTVEPPEECDDGNDVDDDACGNDCRANICGDGIIHPGNGEECDDGNGDDNDFCRNDCLSNFCGDGRLTQTESELLVNGDFESGTLTGWNAAGLGDGAFVISTPGAPTPTGSFATAAHSSGGTSYALADQVGQGVRALEQSFTLPATANSVTVAFDMFVNDQSGLGPIIDPVGLDHTGPPNQHARVDILSPGALPFETGAAVVQSLYLGVDTGPLPNPYIAYTFDLAGTLGPGQTYELRFAEVDNQHFLHQGVDNVSVLVSLMEECDDGNNLDGDGCSAACAVESCFPPGAVTGVRFLANATTLQWSAGSVETFDAVRSDGLPPASGGAAVETCVAQGTMAASVDDPFSPGPNQVLYYLVRGRNSCGPGTYGFASTGSERVSTICP